MDEFFFLNDDEGDFSNIAGKTPEENKHAADLANTLVNQSKV